MTSSRRRAASRRARAGASSGTRSSTSSIAASTRSRSERLVLERRLVELEVALLHGRAQDHVPADPDERRLRAGLQRRHLDDEVLLRLRAAGEAPAGPQLVGRERTRVDRPRAALAGATRTLHFLQVPWPPQVESIATPFQLAASKSVVPAGTRASFTAPSACSKTSRTRSGCGSGSSGSARGALTPPPPPASRGSAAIQRAPHSSRPSRKSVARTASTVSSRAGVHDRARQAVALRDREERRAERVPAGQAERRVRRAAGHVHAELVADQPQRLEEERHRARLGADRHRERVDDHVLGRDPVVARGRDDLLRHLEPPLAAPSGSRRRSRARSPRRRDWRRSAGSPPAARPRP